MADGITASIDPIGLENVVGTQINPATEDTLTSILSATTSSSSGTTPVVYNSTMTLANTEYSQLLPSTTKAITIQCRGLFDVKFTYASLASGTTYFTIKSGMSYYEESVSLASKTLYFQCSEAAQVLEIIAYS